MPARLPRSQLRLPTFSVPSSRSMTSFPPKTPIEPVMLVFWAMILSAAAAA
jgi:hypothetical protein